MKAVKNAGRDDVKHENDLGRDPIGKLVIRLAIPSMIAQFVSVLYSVVDRMYIGHIPQIGDAALAGVGVTGPIVTLLTAFAFWVGVGGAPLMSIRMGEGRDHQARQVVSNCFVMLLAMAVILTALSLIFCRDLLLAFGASEGIIHYAENYMRIYVLGTGFMLIGTGMNQFIIAQGYANAGMISVLIGALTNIILDPILIYGFGMGVEGAAAATVISQLLSAIYVLSMLFGKKVKISIAFEGYSLHTMLIVLKIGLAPFLIIAFDNVLIITLNTVLQQAGGAARGDELVTCFTIVQSFMLLITMPLGGITSGTQAILGFNYGAGQTHRILEAEKKIMILAVLFCTLMFGFAQLAPQLFVRLFTSSKTTLQFCVWAIRIYTLGIIPLAVQYTIVDGFTGMGIVKMAMTLSFLRKANFFVCVFLLAWLIGAEGVFYAEPVIDVLAGLTSAGIYGLTIKKILAKREALLQKTAG